MRILPTPVVGLMVTTFALAFLTACANTPKPPVDPVPAAVGDGKDSAYVLTVLGMM